MGKQKSPSEICLKTLKINWFQKIRQIAEVEIALLLLRICFTLAFLLITL